MCWPSKAPSITLPDCAVLVLASATDTVSSEPMRLVRSSLAPARFVSADSMSFLRVLSCFSVISATKKFLGIGFTLCSLYSYYGWQSKSKHLHTFILWDEVFLTNRHSTATSGGSFQKVWPPCWGLASHSR